MKINEKINISTNKEFEVQGRVVPPNSRIKLLDKSYIIDYSIHSIFRNGRVSSVIGSINNLMSRLFYLLKEVESYVSNEIEDSESFVLYDKVLEINFVIKKDGNKIVLVTIVDTINKNLSQTGIKLFEGEKVIVIDSVSIDYFIFSKTEYRKEIDLV